MRYKSLGILCVIMLSIFLSSCEDTVKPDTEQNATWLMKLAIDENDYERFNELFSEGRKNAVLEESFDAMGELSTAGASYKNYELITFENGEMLLVRLTPMTIDGEYKIEDVMIVPDEMKSFFE